MRVGGSAVAPEGVLCHMHPLGDSPRRSVGRSMKDEVLAEGRAFITGEG